MMNESPMPGRGPEQAKAEPPPLFAQTVRELAHHLGVDGEALIDGRQFECNGIGMWLLHHGDQDPQAAVIVVDMGEFREENEPILLRFALEHNLRTPAGVHGYYGLVPGMRRLGYCIRLDLSRAEHGAVALASLLGTFVRTFEELRDKAIGVIEAAARDGAPAPEMA